MKDENDTETRGRGDRGRGRHAEGPGVKWIGRQKKEFLYAKHPRVAVSPFLRVVFFILHPSSFILLLVPGPWSPGPSSFILVYVIVNTLQDSLLTQTYAVVQQKK